MALSREVYRELEDILGPDNISDDPVVLDVYSFQRLNAGSMDPYTISPEAVVLPGSTEEVQAILRLCNRRGIKSRASSTTYGTQGMATCAGEILLDLRRMNRIIEIDEKNMCVVTEPYVSFAQVQAEVMKKGLNCHVVGAGSNCSYLASLTSMDGNNAQAIAYGYSGRNLLGAEWVLPTGEILRLGSLGSGAGWFSGDGPGPSLRGIIRGARGALGGLGVITKCAGHVRPWPGPKSIEIKGISPAFETEVPPLFEYHILDWPTWEQCADGQYKIGEAGIALVLNKTAGPGTHGHTVTGCNNEYYDKYEELKGIPEVSLNIVMGANSPEEHAYQVKALDQILKDTGGQITPVGEKAIMKNRDFINAIKTCFVPRTAFRAAGSFTIDGLLGHGSVDHVSLGLKKDGVLRAKYAKKGVIGDDGTYNSWGSTFENAHLALFECGHWFDPLDEASTKGATELIGDGIKISLSTPFSLTWGTSGGMIFGLKSQPPIGPLCYNYHEWMRKIKKAFDPNTASDPEGYISPEE
ncbi:MAG: FAD-binding oxidoreductase [Dehalococcoidales bacterium]|jgi:glycolate oxidase